jgi:hypothetical protein
MDAHLGNWQPNELPPQETEVSVGLLEVSGALSQTALIALATGHYTFRPMNLATHLP